MNTRIFNLNRQKMLRWLEMPGEKQPDISVYIKPETASADIEKALRGYFDSGELLNALVDKSHASVTGAVIYYRMGKARLILPPFPLRESASFKSYEPGQLKSMLEKDWCLGLVLVRLGYFAAAVFRGEKLITYKAGTGLVHARHHKGGSSSQRFARHREKQMETFFTRVEKHSRETLEPHLKELDYVLYGGTRDTLQTLRRQCSFFKKLEDRDIVRLLTVREPKFSELAAAVSEAYTCMVYELTEDN